MTDLLSKPVRVDREAERLYFCGGRVSVDLNGSEADRKSVLAFLAQAQEMALAALQMKQCPDPRSKGGQMARERMDNALRAAGVAP